MTVFVFPGQGSQRRGMGEELFGRFPDLVAEADECLGYSIERLCVSDPDRVLNHTQYTQPALYVVNVLHYLDRVAGGEHPDAVAGHSLGEYCALFAAGAFDFGTGLRLVRRRGELMSRAPKGAMAAVLNLDQDRVAEILAGLPYHGIDIANINSRRQCILSGVYDELRAPDVRDAYVAAGAQFVPLNVSAAFHSRCMADVQEEFGRYLAGFDLRPLRTQVVANLTARPYPETGYADHLVRQISSPVRWYESMCWLAARGHREFRELGPGTVLTKLTDKILADLLPVDPEPAPPVTAPPAEVPWRPELVFMFGGQGSQYHQMGRELYDTNAAFRGAMDRCDTAFRARTGSSLLAAVYSGPRSRDFDDVSLTQAALFCVGHSLSEAVLAEGVEPDAVLGHSLGEYVAASVAGVMTFDEGLDLVVGQAQLLAGRCRGGMLSVLAGRELLHRRADLFGAVSLAAVNFANGFVVSGTDEELTRLRAALDELGVVAVRLPVRNVFHSPLLDDLRWDFLSLAMAARAREPRIPVYSAMTAGRLGAVETDHWDEYLWQVVRAPVRFDELVAAAFPKPERFLFVDLSASGSFATFFRHGYGTDFRCVPAINQFGNNTATFARLREELATVHNGHTALYNAV